jgi:hypothetical protein
MIALALPCDGMDSSIEGGSNPISPFFCLSILLSLASERYV